MFKNKRKTERIIEVITGIILLLSTLFILFSYLMHFEFSGQDRSLLEDLSHLSENIVLQRSSAWLWMITACLFALLIPFYLITFYHDQPFIHLLNSLVIISMSVLFFRAALAGLSVSEIISAAQKEYDNINELQTLSYIKDYTVLTKAGLSAFGLYVFLLSICRFQHPSFLIFGRVLLFLSGSALVLFLWINPEHLLFTTAFTLAIIGMLITSVKIVNRGMVK